MNYRWWWALFGDEATGLYMGVWLSAHGLLPPSVLLPVPTDNSDTGESDTEPTE